MKKTQKQRASQIKSGPGLKCERKTGNIFLSSMFEKILFGDFQITASQNSGLSKSGKKAKIKDKRRLGNGSIPKRDKNTHDGIIK